MQPVLFAHEVRSMEAQAVASGSVSLDVLMERAGEAVAAAAADAVSSGDVLVVAGPGNNGGDGWVAARVLRQHGRRVRVVSLRHPDELPEPARSAAGRAAAAGVEWSSAHDTSSLELLLEGFALVIDAVLGIGVSGPVREDAAAVLRRVAESGRPVLSIDVPSGVDADTGALLGPVPHALRTVTFACLKPGLLLYPGAAYAGEVSVADIGLTIPARRARRVDVLELEDYAAQLPLPPADAHKGERGRVLVVAGSRLYAGAAVLAASGAMRMGAGYVFAAVPSSIVPVLQSALPHVIAVGLAETSEGTIDGSAVEHIVRLSADVDAVVLGPGLTAHETVTRSVRSMWQQLKAPLVLDADALNALGPDDLPALRQRRWPTVITPHPGELARLLGSSVGQIQADRIRSALEAAGPSCACVLKGARTIVACAERAVVTRAGNPGMATAGMGDVLAGMVGTLLAQGLAPFEAAALGAYVHARAGDLAADRLTEICLTSKDLPAYLPAAVRELVAERRRMQGLG